MEYNIVKYANIGKVKSGKRLPKGEVVSEIISNNKYIRVRDINGNAINPNDVQYITDDASEKIRNYRVKTSDIIISVVGTVGSIAEIPNKLDGAYLTENCDNLLVDENICLKKYLKHYLISKYGQEQVIANTVGSTQPKLPIYGIENFDIILPNIYIQNKIVKILEAFDNKILINNQTNDNLFELTKQLYKRWFIEFEFPNKDGNPYKASNGKMVESELGLIPENWCIKRLDEISVNFDSKRKPLSSKDREERKGNIPYYGATSIIDYVNEYIFDDIFVLMGEDGSVINSDNTPVLQYIWKKCWINNHAHVLQGKGISTEHLMECLRATDVSSIITGAVQLKINQANMNALKYVYATEETNRDFDEKISKIYEKIRANIEQNEILEQLRDTLLPKLMNGEIDLDKIEI